MVEQIPATLAPDGPPVYVARGEQVMLDSDVAIAFGTTTKRLNQTIRRNADLVDDRHCFYIADEEFDILRSQIVTAKPNSGRRRSAPRVFTARGIARVSTFINTHEALRAADLIVDTFVMVQ